MKTRPKTADALKSETQERKQREMQEQRKLKADQDQFSRCVIHDHLSQISQEITAGNSKNLQGQLKYLKDTLKHREAGLTYPKYQNLT